MPPPRIPPRPPPACLGPRPPPAPPIAAPMTPLDRRRRFQDHYNWAALACKAAPHTKILQSRHAAALTSHPAAARHQAVRAGQCRQKVLAEVRARAAPIGDVLAAAAAAAAQAAEPVHEAAELGARHAGAPRSGLPHLLTSNPCIRTSMLLGAKGASACSPHLRGMHT